MAFAGGGGFSVQGLISLVVRGQGIDQATRSLQGLEAQARASGESLTRAGAGLKSFGASTAAIGSRLALGVTTPLLGLGAVALNAASDLRESGDAVDAVFGTASGTIQDFAKTTADSLGISRQAALQTSAEFGALFANAGFTNVEMADMSKGVVTAAADLAAFYNQDPGDMLIALRAGLSGETEPLKRFGIDISAAKVELQALAMTGKSTAKELTSQELMLARYTLIMEQMGAASGNAADTADTFAGRQRRLKAQLQNTAATLGQQLLPLAERLSGFLLRLVDRFEGLSPGMRTFVVIAAAMAAALGPLLIAVGAVATGIGALAPAFAVLLGPIGLVLAAVALFAIAYTKNWLGIRDLTNGVVGAIVRFFTPLINVILELGGYLKAVATGDIQPFGEALQQLPGWLQPIAFVLGRVVKSLRVFFKVWQDRGFLAALQTIPTQIRAFGRAVSGLLAAMGLDRLATGVRQQFALVATLFGQAVTLVDAIIHGRWSAAWAAFKDVAQTAVLIWIQQMRNIGALLLDIFAAIPWGTIGAALAAGLVAAGQFMLDTGLPWLVRTGAALIIGLLQGIYENRGAILGAIGEIVLGIVDAIGRLGGWIQEQGEALLVWLLLGFLEKLPDILAFFADLPELILDTLGAVADYLVGIGADLINGLIEGINSRYNDVFTFLASIIRGLPDYIGNAGGWLYQVGVDLVTGLINGFYARWLQFLNFVGDLVGGVDDVVKRILGIASPSRVFAEIGELTAEGFFSGYIRAWDQQTREALSAAQQFSRTVQDGLRGVYGAGDAIFGRQIGDFGGAIIAGWEALTDGFFRNIDTGAIQKGILAEDGSFMSPGVFAQVGAAAGTALADGFRSALGVASPSRVFADIGRDTASGFFAGFDTRWRAGIGSIRAGIAGIASPAPVAAFAPVGAGARTVQAGGIQITVNGAGDPRAVAREVVAELDGAFGRLTAMTAGVVS